MSEAEFDALIDRHLDGLTTPEEAEQLSRRLEESPAARADYLRLAGVHAALATADLTAAPVPRPAAGGSAVRSSRWRFGLSGLAAGILVGAVSTSLVGAHAQKTAPPAEPPVEPLPLANGGFERGPDPETDGVPVRAGVWGGDFTRVVPAEQGVSPFRGEKMLRFLRADNALSPPGGGQRTAEVWQTVDLRPVRGRLDPDAVVEASARFAVAADTGPAPKVGLLLAAFAGEPSTARASWPARRARTLAEASKDEPLALGGGAWQRVVVQLAPPPDADFLLLHARVLVPPPAPVRFPGHYLDEVTLHVRPPVGSPSPAR